MYNLPKYKQNLHIDGDRVISYTTHVATIDGKNLIVLGYWSQTTSVAYQLRSTRTRIIKTIYGGLKPHTPSNG